MTVHLDISQLVLDPRRSGIQRAERELIRHWPGPSPLAPCRFDAASGEMVALPAEVLTILCADAPPGGTPAELARLQPLLGSATVVQPGRLLNAELFSDPARAAFYRQGGPQGGQEGGRQGRPSCRSFWLIYDFLPWLHPDWFSIGSAARLMPYLHAMRQVPDLAFISERTRSDFVHRVGRRAADGPVIPMGADGLGLERQRFDAASRNFVMLGTIEPRKNAAPAMQAFRALWREGVDATLTMIGTASPDATVELDLLRSLAGETRFRHLGQVPDETVRQALRGARAMLFPSEGEGFGIPPMEALHAGIPVIVSEGLPALAGQPRSGQIRLDPVTSDAIAGAVRTLLDDDRCRGLWDEAAETTTMGWADFASGVARWVQS